MPSQPRQIIANQLYELEIRTRSGLPFVCLLLVRLLLASAMARTQRDFKVIITHFLWMGNHLHLLFVAKDAEQAMRFYSELMKKITDYYKRLFALPRLELWEPNGAVLSRVLDVESAKDRIAYLFSNPSKANLVDSITDYPGFSSWDSFSKANADEAVTEPVPWIRQPSIPPLPQSSLTERQDRFITGKLISEAQTAHNLTVHAGAAFAVFGIKEKAELASIGESIQREIARREEEYRRDRFKNGSKVLGKNALRRESLRKAHTPKREATDRKVLFHTTIKQLATEFLAQFDAFCNKCREAYRAHRAGHSHVHWPPGAFRPPMGPMANAIAL